MARILQKIVVVLEPSYYEGQVHLAISVWEGGQQERRWEQQFPTDNFLSHYDFLMDKAKELLRAIAEKQEEKGGN